MKRFLFFFLLLASMLGRLPQARAVCGTPGKDGVGPSSGVVNSYFASASSAGAGDTTLSLSTTSRVGAANSIAPGDLLMLWQTQGASISSANDPSYGSGDPANDAAGYTSLNDAGHYEFVRVTSAPDATGRTGVAGDGAAGGLRFSYVYNTATLPKQVFQVIRVPQYSSMTLTGPLLPIKYDGTTGGAIVVDVAGALTFNTAVGANVYQSGFRGGFAPINNYVEANSQSVYTVSTTPRNGAGKGGGIAGSPRYTWNETTANDSGVEGYAGGDGGRGAPGNAGGGGNAHNAGGGGGSNSGGGGRGGFPWEGAALQAGTLTDTVANNDGTTRQVARAGGSGGFPLRDAGGAFTDRLFMGGGGGGGDANDATTGVRGGVGAGVVVLRAGSFVGSTTINANGDIGDRGAYQGAPDGAGGGGAGGTVVLVSRGAGSGTISVNAQGGGGGNTLNDPIDPASGDTTGTSAHGPGGGGGGGTVLYSSGLPVAPNVAGGPSGITNESGTTHIKHGATDGKPGLTAPLSATQGSNLFDFSDACGVSMNVAKSTSTPSLSSTATTATYQITVSNSGTGGASGVVVDDPLPAPFTYDPASPATITYSPGASGPATLTGTNSTNGTVTVTRFGTAGGDTSNSFIIGPGASVVITFPVKVNAAPGGLYNNSAQGFFAAPRRTVNATLVSPGGVAQSGATVPGSNYNGALAANTAEDVTILSLLSGVVYDDVNYSGGPGRAFDSSKMKGVNGARVELYNADGTFNTFVTTATVNGQDGVYSFPGLADGAYFVRVVNGSVLSSRTPTATELLPVQTFQVADETNDGTSNATAFPNRVGGRFPAQTGAGANTTSATLNTTTFALSSGGVAQSVARVEVRGAATPVVSASSAGLAFGFNFDTVVNTNDSGQGSLRQFVLNASALSNTGLAQEGLTATRETSIFMIPSNADPLGRASDPGFASGVAQITLLSPLVISGTNADSTAVDGTTQTANIGDTNAGTFGTGGTVGVDRVPLSTIARPEVEIHGARAVAVGLDIEAASAFVQGVSLWGFGNAGDNPGTGSIRAGSSGSSNFAPPTITGVLLGASAVPGAGGALVSPPGTTYGLGDLVRANGVKGGQVLNSIIAFGGGKGVALNSGADNWTIQGNEIRGNSRNSTVWDNIDAQTAGDSIIANLVYGSGGTGIDSFSSSGGTTVRNNTSRDNGQNCTPTTGEPAGIRSYGTRNTIELNLVFNNYGAGVLVQPGAKSIISRNSIYSNGDVQSLSSNTPSRQIGIDLLAQGEQVQHGQLPFVTPNATGKTAGSGANGLLNFPIFESATLANGQITLQGFAPAGSKVEVFIAELGTVLPDSTGFGEGQAFQFSFTEGSGADSDASTGSYDANTLRALGYSSSVANLAGSETNANRFRVTFPAGIITSRSAITATATFGTGTSEFAPNLSVTPSISGAVYLDANSNGTRENGEAGANLTGFFVKLVASGATTATRAVAVNPDGTFSFSNVLAGDYTLVIDNNSDLSDITATVPPGFTATEGAGGARSVSIGSTSIGNRNFGLYAGYSLSGRVFEDNGSGGGTANDAVQNGTEPAIEGVLLQLKSGSTTVASATSGADGSYSFSIPASYSGQTLSVVELNATGFVSSGAQAGNTTGTYDRATDVLTFAFNTANGTLSGANFAEVKGATLENDGTAIGTRGGSVNFPHVFTAGTTGTVKFSLAQLPTPTADWTAALYLDANGNGKVDAGETQITASSAPIAVTAGQKLNLIVVNYVPQSAPDGASDKITLSATFFPSVGGSNPAIPAQTLARTDLTTVGQQNGLSLAKVVDKSSAKPGELLTYTITYLNTGNAPISNLVVNDATPAFTTFNSAAFAAPLSNNLTGCTITAPTAGQSGSIAWKFSGTLAPGAKGTVSFVVKLG